MTEPDDGRVKDVENRGRSLADLAQLLARCEVTHCDFHVQIRPCPGGHLIWVESMRTDTGAAVQTNSGATRSIQKGRKWYVSPHATDSEVVQTYWAALQAFELHELRKNFLFDGQPIFRPHHPVDLLARFVRDHPNDQRPNP